MQHLELMEQIAAGISRIRNDREAARVTGLEEFLNDGIGYTVQLQSENGLADVFIVTPVWADSVPLVQVSSEVRETFYVTSDPVLIAACICARYMP